MMRSYTCEECGDKWSCCADCVSPGKCTNCEVIADAPRKATKVRKLLELINTLPPISYKESQQLSARFNRNTTARVIESIVLTQCDNHYMWPYTRYERLDGSIGYILVCFEPIL